MIVCEGGKVKIRGFENAYAVENETGWREFSNRSNYALNNRMNNINYKDRQRYNFPEQQLSELQLSIPYLPNKNIEFPSISIFPSTN